MDVLTRWRLILGGAESDGTGQPLPDSVAPLDAALDALYEFERRKKFQYKTAGSIEEEARTGTGGGSNPAVARWLGDIRRYFPQSVVQILQKDAFAMRGLQQKLLLDQQVLEEVSPDVHLVATLLELKHLMPTATKETARLVIRKVVETLMSQLKYKTEQAIAGALHRQARKRTQRWTDLDWNATIRKNLRHYQPTLGTIIPEVRLGFARRDKRVPKEVILCIDQSGSMGASVVYASIYSAVLATLPGIKTRLVAFDTQVVDLTEQLDDPVEMLFGLQLGGGTDINFALSYCQQLITRPSSTILIVLSDLFEGGNQVKMRERFQQLSESGVQLIGLLALSDEGTPAYHHANAQFLSNLGGPVFACTPDRFPELMAAALNQQDLSLYSVLAH
jgi:Mg-chelatase subunit ChlD